MILPNAKIIHIERNPLDTCLSIYTLKFVGHHAYAYSLKKLANITTYTKIWLGIGMTLFLGIF